MKEIFDNFSWHSSIGIDETVFSDKKFVTRLANTSENLASFFAAGDDLLIHKTTKALWRVSDDNATIEPVFGSDILTEDDLKDF